LVKVMVFIGKFKHISYHAVPRTFFVYIKLIIFAKRGTVLFPHLSQAPFYFQVHSLNFKVVHCSRRIRNQTRQTKFLPAGDSILFGTHTLTSSPPPPHTHKIYTLVRAVAD
jgi:hypothetical protein